MNKIQKVITFGCRLNIYESEIIKKNLLQIKNHKLVIFNTCAVTQEAEKQAKQAIRKEKKLNPDIEIIVTGCAAQKNPESFLQMPEVNKVIGNQEKLDAQNYKIDKKISLVSDIMLAKTLSPSLLTNFQSKSRAFIQIQTGCNHRCTFCIIPYLRGNSRSVPIGVIVNQITLLIENGYKEIIMTGINLTSYGLDLPGKPTLAEMVKRVIKTLPQLKRIRLSSIDVSEIDEELFELIAYENKIMPHIHISIQSGDNMILKRMRRRHNRNQVINFCNNLRFLRNDISFGADFIVGFPTETESMFNNTHDLILEANIQFLHIFPYSKRNGTPAAKINPIDQHIIKKRAQILRETGINQVNKFLNTHLNKTLEILIEKNNTGYSNNFIKTKLIDSINIAPGSLIKCKLLTIEKNVMLGKLIDNKT